MGFAYTEPQAPTPPHAGPRKVAVNLALDSQQSKTTLQIHGRPLFSERVGDLKGPAGRYSRVELASSLTGAEYSSNRQGKTRRK